MKIRLLTLPPFFLTKNNKQQTKMPAQNNLTSKLFLGFPHSSFYLFSSSPTLSSFLRCLPTILVPSSPSGSHGQSRSNRQQPLSKFSMVATNQQLFTISVDDFIGHRQPWYFPIPVAVSNNNRWSLKSWITAPDMVPVDAHGTPDRQHLSQSPMTALCWRHYAMITYQPHVISNPPILKRLPVLSLKESVL